MLSLNLSHLGFKVNATMAILFLLAASAPNNAEAQVVSDGTTDSQVDTTEGVSTITGGTQTGKNLFHSFEQFSLPSKTTAHFDNLTDIDQIFSRVTGGSISEIDGLIRTNGSASLVLLNPAGIVFGQNAQLNVGGSFIATTADSIVFQDGIKFAATDSPKTKPLLTVSSPIGLQYGTDSSAIAILPNPARNIPNPDGTPQGLNIKPGSTLALLGGDVSVAGNNLNAAAANVEIGSVKSGQINLQNTASGWQFDYDNITEFGQIDLARTLINTSGIVNLQGKEINLSDNSIVSNFTKTDGEGGIVNFRASESIKLDSSSLFTQVGQQQSDLDQAILGTGGDILFKAPQIIFTNGSLISSGTLSEGAGGNITIDATELVEFSGGNTQKPSLLSTATQGKGAGGQVVINTKNLLVQDGSQVQALAGEGLGGTIIVNATESVQLSGTGTLIRRDQAGNQFSTLLNSGLSASSGIENLPFELQPGGKSGNLIVNTPNLSIDTGAKISVSSFGSGDAGDIAIAANKLNVNTTGQIAANTASGKGGSINLNVAELIVLTDRGAISTTAQQNGNGGNIDIATDNLVLLEFAKINANAQEGTGGNIQINSQGFFIDSESSITASSELGTDGIVKIVTPDIDSKIETTEQEETPLVAEKLITTGCSLGEDFARNQFRNIGRGGVPANPMEETGTEEVLGDLGYAQSKAADTTKKSQTTAKKYLPREQQAITEATNWIVNQQGNLELIARNEVISSGLSPRRTHLSKTACQ